MANIYLIEEHWHDKNLSGAEINVEEKLYIILNSK